MSDIEKHMKEYGGLSLASQYAKMFDSSMINTIRSLQESSALTAASQYAKMLDSSMLNMAKSLRDSGVLASTSQYAKMFDSSMFDIARSLQESSALTAASQYAKMLDSSMLNMAKSLRDSGVLESTSQYAKMFNSSIFDIARSLQESSTLTTASQYAKDLSSIIASPAMQRTIEELTTNQAFLADLAESNSNLANDVASENARNDLGNQLEELGNTKDSYEFSQAFLRLPPYVQHLIINFLLYFVLPVMCNVVANIVTPHVEALIHTSTKPNRGLVKEIANIRVDDVSLSQLRFVTVGNLTLRMRANTKSEMLDTIKLGKVVTVISRNKSWLEVTYRLDGGEVMRGWVFARYTAKFNN